MLCIEFPSASRADVTGPQALDLCGAARALLGDCSPLKTPTLAHTVARASWDLVANYHPFFPVYFFSSQVHHTDKVIYMFIKFGVEAQFEDSLGKQVFN